MMDEPHFQGKRIPELANIFLAWMLEQPGLADLIRTCLGPVIVREWHRSMSMQFHPDRGGSHEAMKAVNVGAQKLRELLAALTA